MATETTTYCARHPKEETAVSCASCGTYICTRCMVVTPVGMKCGACARGSNTALYSVSPHRLLLAIAAALGAGVIASFIGNIGLFAIFISTFYGYAAGSMILKASGMKRGKKMEIIAGAGMVIGAVAAELLPQLLVGSAMAGGGVKMLVYALPALWDVFFWLAVVISTACAVSKIRYL